MLQCDTPLQGVVAVEMRVSIGCGKKRGNKDIQSMFPAVWHLLDKRIWDHPNKTREVDKDGDLADPQRPPTTMQNVHGQTPLHHCTSPNVGLDTMWQFLCFNRASTMSVSLFRTRMV
jgi:hypothetical protein